MEKPCIFRLIWPKSSQFGLIKEADGQNQLPNIGRIAPQPIKLGIEQVATPDPKTDRLLVPPAGIEIDFSSGSPESIACSGFQTFSICGIIKKIGPDALKINNIANSHIWIRQRKMIIDA